MPKPILKQTTPKIINYFYLSCSIFPGWFCDSPTSLFDIGCELGMVEEGGTRIEAGGALIPVCFCWSQWNTIRCVFHLEPSPDPLSMNLYSNRHEHFRGLNLLRLKSACSTDKFTTSSGGHRLKDCLAGTHGIARSGGVYSHLFVVRWGGGEVLPEYHDVRDS